MKRIALFCLLGVGLQANAQKNYKKGLVVLTNGETLKGWIDYRNWHVNPTAINFKRDSLADNPQHFTVADITFFEVSGDKYQKAVITKDMLPVDVNHLAVDSTVNNQTDTAFLRVLVEGPLLNLYEVYDFKPHYYIQDSTKNYRELTFKAHIVQQIRRMEILNYYRDELKLYLYTRPQYDKKLARQIDQASYTERELTKVVIAMNGITGQAATYVPNNNKKNDLSFYVGAGVTYNSMTFSGDNDYFPGLDFGWKTAPVILAGVEFFSERNFKQFSFRGEVGYSSVSYEGHKIADRGGIKPDTIAYYTKQRNFTPSVTALYHIVRKEKFRYYIGAQFVFNVSSYATHRLTVKTNYLASNSDNYLKLDGIWPTVNLKTGAIINQNWDIGVSGSVFSSNAHAMDLHNKVKQYALWLSYHFK